MYVGVPTSMNVHHVCAWCPQWLEDTVRFPGTGVVSQVMAAGVWTWGPPQELEDAEPSLQRQPFHSFGYSKLTDLGLLCCFSNWPHVISLLYTKNLSLSHFYSQEYFLACSPLPQDLNLYYSVNFFGQLQYENLNASLWSTDLAKFLASSVFACPHAPVSS